MNSLLEKNRLNFHFFDFQTQSSLTKRLF